MHPHPSPNIRPALLCFGDSITANSNWVNPSEASGRWHLINAGRAGRKTSDIPTELPPALAAHPEASGLLLLLGVNDLPARDPRSGAEKIASCIANLQLALDLAFDRFPPEMIFLVAPCPVDTTKLDSVNLTKGYDITPSLLAQLALRIEQLALRNHVNFFSLHKTLLPGHFTDGVHPNAAGETAIAQAVAIALSRPAFYLVGDSISIDYHEALAEQCFGRYRYGRKGGLELARADPDHPQGANGGDSAAVLAHLREVLHSHSILPENILVNCGLHDIKINPATEAYQVTLENYRSNLAGIADLVHSTGRRLIWITTTPLDEQRHNSRSSSFHRRELDLAAYNAAALEIMAARHVPVIDLHAFTLGLDASLYRDHVHFFPEISIAQADFLRAALDILL